MRSRLYSLACITTGCGIRLKTEHLKATEHPHKRYLEWAVDIMGCQYKTICKEVIITITSKNGTLTRTMGNSTRNGHIQKIALLAPETGLLYVKEETVLGRYTNQMTVRSKNCNTTYIIQTQVEHPPEWTIIESI